VAKVCRKLGNHRHVCVCARTHVQEDVDKFIDGRSKILLGDEPPGSSSDDGEDEKAL